MKKTAKHISFAIVASLLVVACDFGDNVGNKRINPSGDVIQEDRSVDAFNQLSVATAFEVYIDPTLASASVVIEADDNLMDQITVKQEGSLVTIRLKENTNIQGNATLIAYVGNSDLSEIRGSGATAFFLEETLEANNLDVFLSGASHFEGMLLIENNLTMDISGASNIDIEGSASVLDITSSGASSVVDYDFIAEDLFMELSGASHGQLTVTNSINYSASGASSLNYKGDASVESVEVSGSSTIQKMD